MSDHDYTEEEKDETYKILYVTFLLICVFLFFFLLLNIYDTDDMPGLEAVNDEINTK